MASPSRPLRASAPARFEVGVGVVGRELERPCDSRRSRLRSRPGLRAATPVEAASQQRGPDERRRVRRCWPRRNANAVQEQPQVVPRRRVRGVDRDDPAIRPDRILPLRRVAVPIRSRARNHVSPDRRAARSGRTRPVASVGRGGRFEAPESSAKTIWPVSRVEADAIGLGERAGRLRPPAKLGQRCCRVGSCRPERGERHPDLTYDAPASSSALAARSARRSRNV